MTLEEKLALIDRLPELTVDDLMDFYVKSELLVQLFDSEINRRVKDELNKELKKRLMH